MNNEHPVTVAEMPTNPPETSPVSAESIEVEPSEEDIEAMKQILESTPEEYLLTEGLIELLEDGTLQKFLTNYRLNNLDKPESVHGASLIEKLSGLIADLKQYQTKSPGDIQLVDRIVQTAKELFPKKSAQIINRQKVDSQASVPGFLVRQEFPEEHKPGIQALPDVEDDGVGAEVREMLEELSDTDGLPQVDMSRWADENKVGDFGETSSVTEVPSPDHQEDQFELDQALAAPLDTDWKKLQWSAKEPREASPEKIKIFHEVNQDIKKAVDNPEQEWLVDFTADQVTRGFESSTRDIRTKYRAYDFVPAIKNMIDNYKTMSKNERFSHAEMNTINKFFHQQVLEKRRREGSE